MFNLNIEKGGEELKGSNVMEIRLVPTLRLWSCEMASWASCVPATRTTAPSPPPSSWYTDTPPTETHSLNSEVTSCNKPDVGNEKQSERQFS